ncbi:hypothetical protein PENTCL1PPCAC_10591, partial [Pristionchus entomophagus]
DVFNGKYHAIRKLGFGQFSTVWMCRETNKESHVAIKISKSAAIYTQVANDEIKHLKCIRDADTTDPHRDKVIHLLDTFSISGENGTHVCMVFE